MQDLDDLKVRYGEGHSSLSKFLRDTSTDAFMVLRQGKIITEQYFTRNRKLLLYVSRQRESLSPNTMKC